MSDARIVVAQGAARVPVHAAPWHRPIVKVLVYADFRSPHAQSWRQGLIEAGIDVVAVSSEPVDLIDVLSPSDAGSAARASIVDAAGHRGLRRTILRALDRIQLAHSAFHLLRRSGAIARLDALVEEHRPDLVHALRLPYEGLTALSLSASVPVVVSSWGQDFIAQASRDPALRAWLRRLLPLANGFHFDAEGDDARALSYGLPSEAPTVHAAGNFGEPEPTQAGAHQTGLVVYPRGAVPYANYRGVIEAAVREEFPEGTKFVALGLNSDKLDLERRYGALPPERISLLGRLPTEEAHSLIAAADVVVSPTYSDGIPISLLVALGSGARVVAGDLPQLRDLKTQGQDIVLVDASDVADIARGVREQLSSTAPRRPVPLPEPYRRASNLRRIPEFYRAVLRTSSRRQPNARRTS